MRRDLEWLLNTRRTPEAAGPEYEYLERSLFNYGLPDITFPALEFRRATARGSARMLETAIAHFEPRLDRVKVIAARRPRRRRRQVLRFQIEGLLKMDPSPEHISFDTVLQLSSGEYQVKGDQSAG